MVWRSRIYSRFKGFKSSSLSPQGIQRNFSRSTSLE
jgi:hypothetical protein